LTAEFYYDGNQIKNYLIGFASVFSEIPYRQDKHLKSVPIHYGSPSDIISYLESNVDNDDVHNVNRIKDINIPLFSFRMVAIEQSIERRRAPLDNITVDLRKLGYSVGYVTMKPAPFKFTFELVLWASSDYQAFEISEQILPYFNSPQQVNIEPLPGCPVSTTEIKLESIEIDTEPDSRKCSAIVTMTFTLTGWLLSQPRIWSSNMQFELSMLDSKNNDVSLDKELADKYTFGSEILSVETKPKIKEKMNFYDFLRTFNDHYLIDYYTVFLELEKTEVIDVDGNSYDIQPQIINEQTYNIIDIQKIIDTIKNLKFIYQNRLNTQLIRSFTIENTIIVFEKMGKEEELIYIILKLIDYNVISKQFVYTGVEFSNSDKLQLFGTMYSSINQYIDRVNQYIGLLEMIKIWEEKLYLKDVNGSAFYIQIDEEEFEKKGLQFKTIEKNTVIFEKMKKNLNIVMSEGVIYNEDDKFLKIVINAEKEIVLLIDNYELYMDIKQTLSSMDNKSYFMIMLDGFISDNVLDMSNYIVSYLLFEYFKKEQIEENELKKHDLFLLYSKIYKKKYDEFINYSFQMKRIINHLENFTD